MKRSNWINLAVLTGGLSAAALVAACSSDDGEGGPECVGDCPSGGSTGAGATGGSGGGASSALAVCGGDTGRTCACEGACCPTEPSCYGSVPDGYGDECFAQRNQAAGTPNEDRLQYRLTWARSTEPPGNTNPTVYQVLSSGANLNWPSSCNQSGLGIFIQLLDLDLTAPDEADHRVRTGWAGNQSEVQGTTVAANGLCMVEDTYDSPNYNLPADQMTSTDGWPEGLPPPMARGPRGQPAQNPWQVRPSVLARIPTSEGDFNVGTDRQALLDRINNTAGADGLTFIDRATGYSHSYVPQTWVVVTLGVPIAIPLREAETIYQVNDPAERACMGAYRSHSLLPAADCLSASDQLDPEWGHYRDIQGPAGQAPAVARGYFLITELEQVFSQTLGNTLCVTYPGEDPPGSGNLVVEGTGFFDSGLGSCVSSNWDPSTGSIPKGNWCAATNGPATDDCYDAWRSVTYQTFQAFDVIDANCPGL
jgi:hypothetical protein